MNPRTFTSNQSWIPHFIDTTPIFEPLQIIKPFLNTYGSWPTIENLEQLKNTIAAPILTQSGKPISFTSEITPGKEFADLYEPRIYLTGKIQTRTQNWHDFFNALVWIIFPRSKASLNHIHFQTMQRENGHTPSQRGPLRDAATLFDESGVVVLSSDDALISLLKERYWKTLFWEKRQLVQTNMKFFVFGHSLYEKSLKPYVGMTAKGIVLKVNTSYFKQPLSTQISLLDGLLEEFIPQKIKTPRNLVPIPILGYPGWSNENSVHTYYDNKYYFRPTPTLDP